MSTKFLNTTSRPWPTIRRCSLNPCRLVESFMIFTMNAPRMSNLLSFCRNPSAAALASAGVFRLHENQITSPEPVPSAFSSSTAWRPFSSVRAPKYTFAPLRARNFTVLYPIPVLLNA